MTTEIFTPKPFAEITADMVERIRGSTDLLTDFNVGSIARSLLEANASELDDYYQAVYRGLLKAIPTAVYLGFGFDLKPAVAAAGVARFTIPVVLDVDFDIPQGTRLVSDSGYYYVTDAGAVIAIGELYVDVNITAEVAGITGNTDPSTLSLAPGESINVTATNPASIAAGEDQESEEQRAERFVAYILSLSRGTPAALEYAATIPALYHPVTGVLSERVQRAAISETPGHVDLFVHNGATGASQELIDAVQLLIDGYRDDDTASWVGGFRPAGMRVDVQAMADVPFDVSIEIDRKISYTQAAITIAVQGAIERFVRDAIPGKVIRPIDLINAAIAVEGVIGAIIISPTTSYTVPANAILYLDDFTISWAA